MDMDLEQKAIMRLREAADTSERFYKAPLIVTTSGGKDSSVCVALAEKAGIDFEVMISLYRSHAVSRWEEDESITPQPGDVVFYDWQDSGSGDDRGAADHVGIVSSVSGRALKVIEGNFSNSVKERTLEVNGKYLRGFGLPAYYTKTDNKEDFDMDINEARKQLTSCADTGDTPSAWAKEAAEYCKRKGIFNGDGAGNFGWQQPITREAVACIIYRALEAAGALDNLSDV